MNKKNKQLLLKIIFLFSIVLIGVGGFLSFRQEKILDPVKDVEVVVKNDDSVNITDNGEVKKPKGDILEEENNSVSNEENISSSNNNSNSSNANTNNSNSNSNSSNPNPNNNNNVPVTPPSDSQITIWDTNNQLRVNLENTYNISIKYGNETNGYNVGGMSTINLTDPYKIQSILNELSVNLSHYPLGFFREFSNIGMSLTIYLIDRYSTDNVTGVTDPTTNNVIMSIATFYPFSDSFNHEAYHYIERYIEKKGGNFNSWLQLNPLGFSYGNINSSLSFDRTNKSDSYFVNDYAQTDEDEDRASTFEYMMADSKVSCLDYNQPIWGKASYMSRVIDVFFSTVNSNTIEYWERFL